MTKKIITISRQFGSGGRTVGNEVAAQMGIPCYDEEIINRIAQESGLAKEFIADHEGDGRTAGWIGNIFGSRDFNGHSIQDDLWAMQCAVIEKLAAEGPCVIVGRCADYVLREKADCLTVFIHASMEKRAERIVKVYGEDPKLSAKKRLQAKDKQRRAYYQFYTDMTWGDVQNYHIALDSGELGIENCVSVIRELYNR